MVHCVYANHLHLASARMTDNHVSCSSINFYEPDPLADAQLSNR